MRAKYVSSRYYADILRIAMKQTFSPDFGSLPKAYAGN